MDTTTLPPTGTCHLTTTGRRSGRPVLTEIWFVVVDGRFLLTGTPGARDWLANLHAEPTALLELEGRPPTPVLAQVVTDAAERRQLVPRMWAVQPWYAAQAATVEEWVAGSPVVELRAP